MFDFVFAVLAMAAAANPPSDSALQAQVVTPRSVVIGSGVRIGADVLIEGGAAFPMPQGMVGEPQTASGKFTTATEVKPIMAATKGNWIAVRDYGGSDLLYLTHIWSWRCGVGAMAIAVNGGPVEEIPLPACHPEYATPNAILEEDGLPYLTYPQGSIAQVTVHIIYDDLTRDEATFSRSDVLIP